MIFLSNKDMKNLLIILMFLAAGCTLKQKMYDSQISISESPVIEVNISYGDNISFLIKNVSEKSVEINQPTKLNIEKFNNGSWQQLKILLCPCDAPCHAPIKKEEITPGESYMLIWNKQESWCGSERVNNVRNTIKKTVTEGTFRIKIDLLTNERIINSIYKEFTLN